MKPMLFRALCLFALGLAPGALQAQTASGNFEVRINIAKSCSVAAGAGSLMNFGNGDLLTAAIDQTSQITVTCTDSTPYNVGLSAGGATGATVTDRRMTGPGSATVRYGLFRDSARTQNWGVTSGTDAVAGTGTGAAQTLTVYGRVPVQNAPAAGTYTDTVAVTVTY